MTHLLYDDDYTPPPHDGLDLLDVDAVLTFSQWLSDGYDTGQLVMFTSINPGTVAIVGDAPSMSWMLTYLKQLFATPGDACFVAALVMPGVLPRYWRSDEPMRTRGHSAHLEAHADLLDHQPNQ